MERKGMSEICELVGEFIYGGSRGHKCKADGSYCAGFDKPDLVKVCPTLKKYQDMAHSRREQASRRVL
jgi:hypothetical protein